jgi:hypothetical protein
MWNTGCVALSGYCIIIAAESWMNIRFRATIKLRKLAAVVFPFPFAFASSTHALAW